MWHFRCCLMSLLVFLSAKALAQDLFDIKKVHNIKITISEQDWERQLDSFKQRNIDQKLSANCTVDSKKIDNIGISFKGNSSYFNVKNAGFKKLPFHLKASQYNKKQLFFGKYKSIKLSNVFRDPSYVREVLSYWIARSYMHAPKCNFANLYINNKLYGLYNCTESVDEQFLEEAFGSSTGTFVKCDPDWQTTDPKGCPVNEKASLYFNTADSSCLKNLYELQSESGYGHLIDLMKVLHKNVDSLEHYLNIDETLWYIAFNNVLVNLDSYSGQLSHNYYLYQDTFGIFHPVVWDLNLSFGGFRHDGFQKTALSLEQMQKMSPLLHYQNPLRPLISTLMKSDRYKKQYLAHMRTILKDYFEAEQYLTVAKDIRKSIDDFVKKDSMKLYPYETFVDNFEKTSKAGTVNIVGIRELMLERSKYLLSHPLIAVETPALDSTKHTVVNGKVTISTKMGKGTDVTIYYRTTPFAPFRQVKIQDDGLGGDKFANDGVFGIELPYEGSVFHYYLCAYNEKAAAFYPETAAKTFVSVK